MSLASPEDRFFDKESPRGLSEVTEIVSLPQEILFFPTHSLIQSSFFLSSHSLHSLEASEGLSSSYLHAVVAQYGTLKTEINPCQRFFFCSTLCFCLPAIENRASGKSRFVKGDTDISTRVCQPHPNPRIRPRKALGWHPRHRKSIPGTLVQFLPPSSQFDLD